MRLVLPPFLALSALALGAACGGSHQPQHAALSRSVVQVEPIAAETPQELLDATLAQVGGTGMVSAQLGSPPAGFRGEAWLTFRLPSDEPGAAYAHWAALLAAAVYRDQAGQLRFPALAGTSFADESSALGDCGPHQRYRLASEAALARAITRKIGVLGLHLDSLRFLRPEGLLTPVVVVRAPSAFLARYGGTYLGYSIVGSGSPQDGSFGYHVEVVDSHGGWVQSLGLVPTIGTGWGDVANPYRNATRCGSGVVCVAHG